MAGGSERYGMLMTAVANRDDGARIAKSLIEKKLAACVQLMPIESFYRWKGNVANETEVLMLIKTKTALFDAAIAAIKDMHPYEVPEIVGTEFTAGLAAYFEWIDVSTR